MIDVRGFRNDPDYFLQRWKRRGQETFDLGVELLNVDSEWRALVAQADELRSQQKTKGKPSAEQLEELKAVKEKLQAIEAALSDVERRRNDLLARLPNLPQDEAPEGFEEEDAVEIRRWGEPPALEEPKEHTEIGRFDMERAARVSGARFGYLVGDTALVAFALYRWALDRLVEEGHVPLIPPVLVREEAMYGTGFFPSEKHDFYEIPADGLYLVGTSEVPMASFHMSETLDELPLRYVAFSSCFRREAGAAGRDTRGMFRVHQFQKVEMFVFCEPGASSEEHERLLAIEEELAQALGLPYRVVDVAAGDLGGSAARKFDVEAWFPFQQRYREITSTSNTTDYQARRLGIRRREGGPPHTLNGTAAVDRWVLAILENFQGDVPPPLQAYGAPARVSR